MISLHDNFDAGMRIGFGGCAVKRILLVEGCANLGALYQEEFDDAGYHTLRASNAHEALQVLGKSHLDLVLLDINMVGMNGFELLRRVTAERPCLPIIINSTSSSNRDIYCNPALTAFVVKCSDLRELMLQIQRVLPMQEPRALLEHKIAA